VKAVIDAALSKEEDKAMTHLKSFATSLLSCALAIGVLASAPAAAAQSSSTTIKVDVPFAFRTASQLMPAGIYRIDLLSDHTVLLRGPGSHASTFVMVHSAIALKAPSKGAVVFDRYGNTYYLHQIWTQGDNSGRECSKSKAETETLQAQNSRPPTLVEVALLDDTRR
jgi:hypothetical protein